MYGLKHVPMHECEIIARQRHDGYGLIDIDLCFSVLMFPKKEHNLSINFHHLLIAILSVFFVL